jgi:Raf kinase inhibitor-like YbhB/YbcL family protein
MGQPESSTRARRAARSAAVAAVLALTVPACGLIGGGSPTGQPNNSIKVSSPSLREGAPLPVDYSCEKRVGNPPLRWSGVPLPQAESVAIVVDDNNARAGSEVHWVVYDIDPRTTELGEGIGDNLPDGARQGRTTSGKVGYAAPCRSQGNYRFTVYALDAKVDLEEGASLPKTLKRIAERTIAWGRLTTVHIE